MTARKDTLEDLVALNLARGVGMTLYRRLVEAFGSVHAALGKSEATLRKVRGIGPVLSRNILEGAQARRVQAELELAARMGVRILAHDDAAYPADLRALADHPIVLYQMGELRPEDTLAIAVVGSRRSTTYGSKQAETLSRRLAERGVTVISGLARGIDTGAHRGALQAGRTIAVLGSGLNRLYPPENRKLAMDIARSGAVLTEVPLNGAPDPQNFPRRNRLVSGLSLGVLVVEAPVWSGAMITVEWALEQGKEVFAVPGRVDSPASQGCHALIKQGAKLVESVEDVIDELEAHRHRLRPAPAPATAPTPAAAGEAPPGLSARERTLWDALGNEPIGIEGLIEATQLPPAAVLAGLLDLEMKRLARSLPGKRYARGQ